MDEPETKAQIDALLETARREGYAQGFADAKRKILTVTADDVNALVNRLWIDHEALLKRWANELGRTLHTAIPGRDVTPSNQHDNEAR